MKKLKFWKIGKALLITLLFCTSAFSASITDFGAIGDGITNNDRIFNLIQEQETQSFFVPDGTYLLSEGYKLTKKYNGPGIIKIGMHKQANNISHISEYKEEGDIGLIKENLFNGDMSQIFSPEQFTLSGSCVPDPGYKKYRYYHETSPYFTSFIIDPEVGSHQYNNTLNGRTGVTYHRVMMFHKGFGDAAVWNAYVECGDPFRDSSEDTRFGYNAGIIINGDMKTIADYAYNNPLEFHLYDNGYKASSAGLVVNFYRTNPDTSKNNTWWGTRMQSFGSTYCDSAYSASGKWKYGIDFTSSDFGGNRAAITLKANDKIYFNSVGDNYKCTSVGNSFMRYNPSIDMIEVKPGIYINGYFYEDYVFEDDYNLMPLDTLNTYIIKNKHLPGMTINNTDRLEFKKSIKELLVKVEENSLYIIQLHDRIKKLEKQLQEK